VVKVTPQAASSQQYYLALRNFGNVGFNPECIPAGHPDGPPRVEEMKVGINQPGLVSALPQK
jgi:hypothetical protein